MKIGDKVKFAEEKQSYTVKAIGKRYAVCTKPFNPKHTVLYTIVDFLEKIRGAENLVFGMGAESYQDCEDMLNRLENGKTEISQRNRIELKIDNLTE
jgi:hypothetical protein